MATVVLGGIGASGVLSPRRGDGAKKRASAEASDRGDDVPSQIADLRADLERVAEKQSSMAMQLEPRLARPAEEPSAAHPTPVAAQSPEQARARAEQNVKDERALLEGVVSTQGRDPAWSAGAARSLKAIEMAGAKVSEAECYSTVCRMSVTSDDKSQLHAGLRKALASLPWSGAAFFYASGEGAPSATIYVAREGQPLPTAEGSPEL